VKRRRQQAILDIVRREALGSQQAIMERLRDRGFEVTQPTVSRDLEELGLVRVRDGRGQMRYAPPDQAVAGGSEEHLRRAIDEFLVSMESSRNLVVLKTPPGAANTLAQALDAAEVEGVIGTVAGDDTILVVAAEGVRGSTVQRRLEALMTGEAVQ
jgi:transcriptional regulator of arginine metabolism